MENLIITPRNKVELEFVSTLMERMNIKTTVERDKASKKKKKSDFLDSLPERLNEVKLHMEGKIKLKNAKDLLNEL